ncbi:hypothetical protein J6590_004445 [Homalodisca vitripennis]|nr:hypothetical protein J6590_004445 [Homalodisca vitripennis]
MARLSRIYRDQPSSPTDRLVFWVEYLLRHGGGHHLRPASALLPCYELYKDNMARLSRIYRDQPTSPADRLVFWVEYVLRHGGAHHLRPASALLTWYQLYLIDSLFVLSRYKDNMARLSRIYRDQPTSPADRLVFWVEYVLRHGGAHHLRPASALLPWYQLYLIDILFVLSRYKDNMARLSRIYRDQPTSPADRLVFWVEYVLRHGGAHHLRPASALLPWYQLYLIDSLFVLSRYKDNMARLSRIYRDQPTSPADRLVFWVEYVLRHGGAHHLRPASALLPWYQLYLIDILALLLATASVSILFTYFIIRKIYRLIFVRQMFDAFSSSKKKN